MEAHKLPQGIKPIKILNMRPENIKKVETAVDIVPLKIDYSGEAKVDAYFRSKKQRENCEDDSVKYTSNLYGRKLLGTEHVLPKDQVMYFMEHQQKEKQTNLKVVGQCDKVINWHLEEDYLKTDQFELTSTILTANNILHDLDDDVECS